MDKLAELYVNVLKYGSNVFVKTAFKKIGPKTKSFLDNGGIVLGYDSATEITKPDGTKKMVPFYPTKVRLPGIK